MEHLLSQYVLRLDAAAQSTHRAEDRPAYRALLAEAAVLLSRAVEGASLKDLLPHLIQHERTRGHTWIAGAEHIDVDAAWEAVIAQAPAVRAT